MAFADENIYVAELDTSSTLEMGGFSIYADPQEAVGEMAAAFFLWFFRKNGGG